MLWNGSGSKFLKTFITIVHSCEVCINLENNDLITKTVCKGKASD